ncbi:hypothetical protein BJY52DRAFT_1211808 [Lactarius psammicola]|nr:hypothetical protein BJY52DRAFT_1211808 [Lactarius psammicola]
MRPSELTLNNFEDVLRQFSASILFSVTISDSSKLLFLFPLFFTALVLLLFFRGSVRNPGSSGTPPELLVLQKILVPTSSRWGLSSCQLVARSRVSSHRTIWLSLDALVHCIISGDVELRHPPRDLPDLLHSTVLVDGWDVRLYVHLFHRFHAILWTIFARFFDPGMPLANAYGHSLDFFDLDFVPHWKLKVVIRHLTSSITQGVTTSLLLTTKAQGLSIFDARFTITTLFFRPPRTTLPFTTSLPTVLSLLGTHGGDISVLSVDNITERYAESLFGAANTLCNDSDTRGKFISRNSLVGWRRECLHGVWEAALLKAGLLVKWKITFKKN